jgi:hypothetical protein
MAPEQEDPMHSSLHSCTFGQKAPRRSLASLEVRGAAKPLTQVRKILMNPYSRFVNAKGKRKRCQEPFKLLKGS